MPVALNLPEEIFRGLEPEPKEADSFIDALRERMVALEEEFRALAAKTSEEKPQEPQESPSPEEPRGPRTLCWQP